MLSNFKKNPIYFSIILIIFILASIHKLAGLPFPYFHNDSGHYLFSAIDFIKNHKITCYQENRNFVYPLFLAVLLKIKYSLKIIPLVQHILGLAGGLFIILLFEDFYKSLKPGKVTAVILRTGTLLVLVLYLFSYSANLQEHYIMVESITGFFMIMTLYLFSKSIKSNNVYFISFSFFILYDVAYLQPRYIISVIIVSAILLFMFFKKQMPVISKLWIIIISSALIIIFLFLPNKIYKSDIPKSYYSFVVASKIELICKQLKEDLAENKKPVYDRKILQDVYASLTAQLPNLGNESTHVNRGLFSYYNIMRKVRENTFKGDTKKMDMFFRHYIVESLIHEPLLWAKAIFRELGIFYYPNMEIFGKNHYLSLHNLISLKRINMQHENVKYKIMETMKNELIEKKELYSKNYYEIQPIEKILKIISLTFSPILLLFFILYVPLKNFYKNNPYFHMVFFINIFIFFTCLTSAIAGSLEIHRFIEDMTVIILTVYFLMMILLIDYLISNLPIINKRYDN